MSAIDYVTIASKAMFIGGGFACVCILIGYVIFNVFRLMEGGDK